jgi:hypothetical protein
VRFRLTDLSIRIETEGSEGDPSITHDHGTLSKATIYIVKTQNFNINHFYFRDFIIFNIFNYQIKFNSKSFTLKSKNV